ncbi:MAG: riboflavin-binding protein RibY [Chloroflexota bacterium]|nr:MAG: riboflavin-binding protein RibY [Chloroflexota bacterium]
MSYSKMLRASLMVMLVMLTVAACTNADDTEPKATPTPIAVKLFTVVPQVYLAGYMGADQENYFEQENLSSEILFTHSALELDFSEVLAKVAAGEGQFGIASADSILVAREQGLPIVALASIYQEDPTSIISLASKNIAQPADLEGKEFVVWSFERPLRLFAHVAGLDMEQVGVVYPPQGSTAQGSTMFITGEVDGMVVDWTATAVQATAGGVVFDVLTFSDFGFVGYPCLLFTTEEMIQNQPDVVQHFVNAFVRGMQYAVQHPDEMLTWFVENYNDDLFPQQRVTDPKVMEAIAPFIAPPDSQPGVMDEGTWQTIHDTMVEAGMLTTTDVRHAYTRLFVNAYYKND